MYVNKCIFIKKILKYNLKGINVLLDTQKV
jgi:hypothetical protein